MSAVLLLAPLFLDPLLVAEASTMEKRLWEVSVRRFERADAEADYADDAILFYGSSSIRLWRSIEDDMAPRPVIQRGYGGARLSDAKGFVHRVVHPHAARAIVVFIANDIDGRPNQPTPERVGEMFGELLANIREAHPTTPVLWVEVTPTPARFDLWPLVQQASDEIAARCEDDENAHFVRTADAYLAGGVPNADLFKRDGIHQNAEGYAVWAGLIHTALDRIVGPVEANEPSPAEVPAAIAASEPREQSSTRPTTQPVVFEPTQPTLSPES